MGHRKVGILTVTGDNNYGNKLQNYALQSTLRDMGTAVETVRIESIHYFSRVIKAYIQFPFRAFMSPKAAKRIKRRVLFYQFNRHIRWAKRRIDPQEKEESIKKKLASYDYLFYGSDQIWNPELPQYSDVFLGKFAPREKNIAISASMGIATISQEFREEFNNGMKNFCAISVREESAKATLQDLDKGLNPAVLLDPTMMIGVEQWKKIEKPVQTTKPYILTYFLGEEDAGTVNEIVHDTCESRIDAGSSQPYGPGEFIYLIRNADAVATDSFHATVFSILFGVRVFVFQRTDKYSSMNSRFSSLLNKTGISYQQCEKYLLIEKDAIKDEKVKNSILQEQEKFRNFIAQSMSKNGYKD